MDCQNGLRLKKLEFPDAKVATDKQCGVVLSQVVTGQQGRYPLLFTGTAAADKPCRC